jgi:probable addiction module antidote protein
MSKAKTRPYDSARYLDTPEAIAAYLTEALETEDSSFIAFALGTVARAKGMSEIARKAGLSRENLYRSLDGQTKPELDTVIRVLGAVGLTLAASPKPKLPSSKPKLKTG